jgi:hypothetical protein
VNDVDVDITKRVSVPYIKNISEEAARILRKGNVSVAHKPSNTLRMNLMRIKDKKDLNSKSGVVYSIPCSDCNKQYIGETSRLLGTRLSEHNRDIDKCKEQSRVAMHVKENDHRMNFDECKVIYNERSLDKRLFLEAWASNDNTFNRHVDINPIYKAANFNNI